MLASHRSLGSLAPQSVVRVRPDAATKSSNASCSCQPSPRSKAIPCPVPTTIENEPKESATIKPSSPSLDTDQTSSSRCSETAPSTNPGLLNLQQQLDDNYRSTPRGWSDDPPTRATAQSTLILGLLCPLHCPHRTLGITGIATTARGGIFHPVGLGLCGTPILPSHLGNGLRKLHDSLNRLVYIRHP